MRRRFAGLLVFALALAVPASASAADVTVVFPRDGGQRTVSIGSLSGSYDVDSAYDLISASGQTTSKQIRGISIRALLAAVSADPTYSAVTIARPGGGSVRISRTQIEASGLSPVVYQDGGLSTFVRPAYAADDRNAGDVISASPLVITQVDGTDYGLKAKASKSTAKAGQSLKFSAQATGAAGQKLIFTWNFNDGKTAQGAEVSHKFKKRGYYRVLVSVRGEGESSSVSTVVTVQVGKAEKSKQKREGGGTNDAAGAPISGRADGSSGNGAVAGSTQPQQKKRKKKQRDEAPEQSSLEAVTGELLVPETQTQQQNDLAARSGQQADTPSDGGGLPGEAAGAAVALGLLGFGIALELGGIGRLRRRVAL